MNPIDTKHSSSSSGDVLGGNTSPDASRDPNPPTVAPFSSTTTSSRASYHQVFQKSPLLATTPPQITRVLSQSYPYVRSLDRFAGLVTWTTEDPWESFLLVSGFWALALYGDLVMIWAGNVLVVGILILGMYLRNHGRKDTHPSLDDIVDTLSSLTTRLDILTSPFFTLTTFLSTNTSATEATTRYALTNLFIRILFISPVWIFLTLPPFRIITSRRILLLVGTTILSWHSRPARVTRTVLWRSLTVRNICERVTGLNLTHPEDFTDGRPTLPPRGQSSAKTHIRTPSVVVASHLANKSSPLSNPQSRKSSSPGVRFTFSIWENQRRWLGVGWTSSLFAYERAAWTDEHLNPCPSIEDFTLPEAKNGMKWQWVAGEDWRVEGEDNSAGGGKSDRVKQDVKDKLGGKGEEGKGWIYYDNKWRDGKRGVDGWGKYTRRRRFTRNAELVEDEGVANGNVQELQGSEVTGLRPEAAADASSLAF